MKLFKSPGRWLAGVDADTLAPILAAAADMTIVLDNEGVVLDAAFQSEALALEFPGTDRWAGRPWRDAVMAESQPRIDEMLHDAQSHSPRNSRQVNFLGARREVIPVLFTTLALGDSGRQIAFGRDLRAFTALQQRMVDVQKSFERDFARMRQIETRYRILIQMTPDPVLLVDLDKEKIIEANPVAQHLAAKGGKLIGQSLEALAAKPSRPAAAALLAALRSEGRVEGVALRFAGDVPEMTANAISLRQGAGQLALIWLASAERAMAAASSDRMLMLKLIEQAPDGFVVTDQDGNVTAANHAFLEMTQLRSEAEARGRSLDRWLGRPGVDLSVLLSNLRQHGAVRLFSTSIRDEFGAEIAIEISAGAALGEDEPGYGFTLRPVERSASAPAGQNLLPRSLDQIAELIGRVTLKDLLREATDVIERLSIQAALTMTGDNRASAAEMLGLSRQSLYVKMRRFGLLDSTVVE